MINNREFKYKHEAYQDFQKKFTGEMMIAAENMSALATRGHYDFPSDRVRIWPPRHKVPFADNLINFSIEGEGFIAGVDNGYQASLEPFKANYRKAYNGMCLVILQNNGKKGTIKLTADSEGLKSDTIKIKVK